MNLLRMICVLAVSLAALAPSGLAQGTYTQIDYPGAIATEALSVDTAGDITGLYIDASDNWHGFLLSNGTYTTIDYPGAQYTYPFGINDKGQIVGSGDGDVGFLYDVQTRTFTTLSEPRATQTQAYSINNAGIIGGGAYILHDFNFLGFALIGSTYYLTSPPGAGFSYVLGVTDSGKLIVLADTPKGANLIFSYYKGIYSQIPIPSKPNSAVYGVNPQGTAFVGWYNPSSTIAAGFLYPEKGIFTTLEFPGSNLTYAYGINRGGEVVGLFGDAEGNEHGFTWTPPADGEKK
jgi:probable HAF family extracellular repeat protein